MSPSEPMMAKALGDLAGATRGQIQYWADNGVLRCVSGTARQGTGRKRLFAPTELPFAKLAAILARNQIGIGPLAKIIKRARKILSDENILSALPDWLVIYAGKIEGRYAMDVSSTKDLGDKVAVFDSAIVVRFNEVIGLGSMKSFKERWDKVPRNVVHVGKVPNPKSGE